MLQHRDVRDVRCTGPSPRPWVPVTLCKEGRNSDAAAVIVETWRATQGGTLASKVQSSSVTKKGNTRA